MANTRNGQGSKKGAQSRGAGARGSQTRGSAARGSGAKGKTTGTANRNSKNSKNGQMYIERDRASNSKRQMGAIVLFAAAVFILAVTLIPGGNLWGVLQGLLFGLMGVCAYVFPLVLIYVAVMISLDRQPENIKIKVLEGFVLIVLICGAINIFAGDGVVDTFGQELKDAYVLGCDTSNGGAFGALISWILLALFASKLPACITIILLIFVFLMLITRTSLISLFETMWKPVQKVSNDAGEYIENAAIQFAEKREAKKFNPDVDLGPEADLSSDPFSDDEGDDVGSSKTTRSRSKKSDDVSAAGAAAGFGAAGSAGTAGAAAGLGAAAAGSTNAAETAKTADLSTSEPKPSVLLDDIIKKAAKTNTATASTSKDGAPSEEDSKPTLTDADDIKPGEKRYRLPPVDCLTPAKLSVGGNSEAELRSNADKLVEVLRSFGVETNIVDIARGPSVTRYELTPAAGVRISKITGLADDIAMSLAASDVRIEAPIPNKAAVGIEVPNKNRDMVSLREIVDSKDFKSAKSKLNVALGRDIAGNICMTDLAKMPHLLIAGTTGSGKSVCLNSMILSILYNATPDEVKLVMIDPKQVEFMVYNSIPHLMVPVVSDPHKASGALAWAVKEMLNRYKSFSENNVRDINGYNDLAKIDPEKKHMPQIVIFIDELADLMMAAPNEVEDSICRLAQMARAAGMHLVIATQRPSADVITGLIKANIPSRLSLSVSSAIDSRIILDMAGAEKLLGNGDMLFNPIGTSKPTRIQGCYISDKEVENVVDFIREQLLEPHEYNETVMDEINKHAEAANSGKGAQGGVAGPGGEDSDSLLPDAIAVVVEAGQASTTLIQRRLKVGYARAGRIVDELEERGIIGPYEGSKPRKVLITKNQWLEMNAMGALDSESEKSEEV